MLCKSMLDLDITYSRGFFCDHLATASAAAVVLYGIRSVGRVVTIADQWPPPSLMPGGGHIESSLSSVEGLNREQRHPTAAGVMQMNVKRKIE